MGGGHPGRARGRCPRCGGHFSRPCCSWWAARQLAGTPPWLYWTLYLACYVTGGWEPGWAGLQALRDKTLDVDLLMVAAAIGAAAIGQSSTAPC